MKRFSILNVNCQRCDLPQASVTFTGRCPRCRGDAFRVEIERTASGWESYEVADFIRGTSSDGPAEPYWRTQDILTCAGVSGVEISDFCGASMDERHRSYVGWKRRELEDSLGPGQRVCGRCRVIYTVYANEWNGHGFCSRSCESAATKSRRASG